MHRTITEPSRQLHHLIMDRAFDSRLSSRIDSLRGYDNSWYNRTRVAKGHAAAEAELKDWMSKDNLLELCDAPKKVAQAMLVLAQLDDERRAAAEKPEEYLPFVRSMRINSRTRLAGSDRYRDGGLMILATNPHLPHHCTNPIPGDHIFGRGGELGLHTIGLRVGGYDEKAQLFLLLPHPKIRASNFEDAQRGYAIIEVDTDGSISGTAVQYYLYNDAIGFALGETTPEKFIGGSTIMSGANVALEFPGADEYFSRNIPLLTEYLKGATDLLVNPHSH